MSSRRSLTIVSVLASLAVVAFAIGLRRGSFPLGVPGEWEWLRLPVSARVSGIDVVLTMVGIIAFGVMAALGNRSLAGTPRRWREAAWLTLLVVSAFAVEIWTISQAPPGYGLERWVIALYQRGSNGYFTIARTASSDLDRFLADYPAWIQKQDALHIGTHPPGLITAEAMLLRTFAQHPDVASWINRRTPEPVEQAFRLFLFTDSMTGAEKATLLTTGVATLLFTAGVVVPLYLLARSRLTPSGAWSAAVLWPLAPSVVMFQPTADTALPLIAAAAMACAAHAPGHRRGVGLGLAVLAGVWLGLGMQVTLAFLAVGLVVAILLVVDRGVSWLNSASLVVAVGVGFLAVTLLFWAWTRANPFEIWWWNQKHHARFYQEYPRSLVAWIIANPIELAVGLGLPAVVWMVTGLRSPRTMPVVGIATALTLLLLTLTGRNLSEVGRLWLPFMPALLVLAGAAMERLEACPRSLAATVIATGVQTLILQSTIQVIYPV
ncbi:MAG: hypothetical protein U0794_07870 [Isosphaeraceae bacterium]